MNLSQLFERFLFMFGILESLVAEGSVKRTLIDGVSNIAHDTFRTHPVVFERLETIAAKVEHLQRATNGGA